MSWSEQDKKEIAAWQKPKVGDYIFTPSGIDKVTHVTECTWSASHYGNVPFWESGNWRVFKVLSQSEVDKYIHNSK